MRNRNMKQGSFSATKLSVLFIFREYLLISCSPEFGGANHHLLSLMHLSAGNNTAEN